MIRFILPCIVCTMIALQSPSSFAGGDDELLADFKDLQNNVKVPLLVCSLRGATALDKLNALGQAPNIEEVMACPDKWKAKGQEIFKGLRDRAQNKKAFVIALKNYWAAALAAFNELTPTFAAETSQTFQSRIESRKRALDELAIKVELEI